MTPDCQPSSELTGAIKDRILTAIRTEPAPTRRDTVRHNAAWLAGGVVVALLNFFALKAIFSLPLFAPRGVIHFVRPNQLIAATSFGWIVAAFVATQLAFVRGRSMLGRPTAWLVALITGAPLVLLAWKFVVTRLFDGAMTVQWTDRIGWKCLGLSLGVGLALLSVFTVARRRTDPLRPGIVGAALGMAAGIAAGALVDLWCPVAYVWHVLLGHILPLLVLAAIGALAGRRFVRL